MTKTTVIILRQIESLGYAVSVHRMGDYCEMHAVLLADSDQQHIARSGDGDAEDDAYRTACLLAEMVGIELMTAERLFNPESHHEFWIEAGRRSRCPDMAA